MPDFIGITKSRLRQKLLVYFFTNSNSNSYVREIAAILAEDAGNISKELSRLEEAGIFISSTKGKQKHYSINKKNPLYKELKSIVFKTVGAEGALREAIGRTKGVIFSFIYGSFARNKESSASDLDLLIVGNPEEDKLMQRIESLEKRLQREINYNIYTRREFKNRVKKKDSFIKNILERPKIILKGSVDEI